MTDPIMEIARRMREREHAKIAEALYQYFVKARVPMTLAHIDKAAVAVQQALEWKD